MLLTKKQTKKSSENNTPSPYRGGVKIYTKQVMLSEDVIR